MEKREPGVEVAIPTLPLFRTVNAVVVAAPDVVAESRLIRGMVVADEVLTIVKRESGEDVPIEIKPSASMRILSKPLPVEKPRDVVLGKKIPVVSEDPLLILGEAAVPF